MSSRKVFVELDFFLVTWCRFSVFLRPNNTLMTLTLSLSFRIGCLDQLAWFLVEFYRQCYFHLKQYLDISFVYISKDAWCHVF